MMLMKVQAPDFHAVYERHRDIHTRLENWARCVEAKPPSWVHPMWKQGRSNGRQWEMPQLKPNLNTLDGMLIEKEVFKLPEKTRYALRWCYVYRSAPAKAVRDLAVTYERLAELIHNGRDMLVNRRT